MFGFIVIILLGSVWAILGSGIKTYVPNGTDVIGYKKPIYGASTIFYVAISQIDKVKKIVDWASIKIIKPNLLKKITVWLVQ